MGNASGPESRTMPTPPSPGGVAMATMVSVVEIIDNELALFVYFSVQHLE